jgi:hypothetical protein
VVPPPDVGAGALPAGSPSSPLLLPPPPQAAAATLAAQIKNSMRQRSEAREGEEETSSIEFIFTA